MSEPNDTAQEGFDQLKRNLEVRYPEDSDLSLDEFLNVESLLALAVRVCGPGTDPRKADRLLSNYQLIRPETIGADGHLMQMARRHLFSLASSTAWRRLLGLYERAEYERYRFFDIANGGMALKRMLHGIVRATGDRPELLLVNSYGRIRQRDWWPGISDSGLESGPLSYGPTGYEEPLGLAGSKLRILRIRSGLNGEVPDWFTDEVAAGGADDGTVPNRRDKQGLFKMDGYFLALAPRPGDAQYKWSARGSKYDSPTAAFCEKTINEYCLLSPGGEAEALASVKYAEALRGCMVQLYKNDMRVNLPAPLHLAEQVEEYIWDWGLTGRR